MTVVTSALRRHRSVGFQCPLTPSPDISFCATDLQLPDDVQFQGGYSSVKEQSICEKSQPPIAKLENKALVEIEWMRSLEEPTSCPSEIEVLLGGHGGLQREM